MAEEWTDQEVAQLKNMADDGKSASNIAQQVGHSEDEVRQKASQEGINLEQ